MAYYAARYAARDAGEDAKYDERERLRIGRIIDLYDAARGLPPCPARVVAEATLEHALKLHGAPVAWRDWVWSWDCYGASLVRHKRVGSHQVIRMPPPREPRVYQISGQDGLNWDDRGELIAMPGGGGNS